MAAEAELNDERFLAPPGPFSMTDEEKDFGEYQSYLRTLTPEALWDVHAHLDADNYPRRAEAVCREMARRRLFYVSPYTQFENRLRLVFGMTLLFAVFAVMLHFAPVLASLANQASQELGGAGVADNGWRIALVADLSKSELRTLAALSLFFRTAALLGVAITVPALFVAGLRLLRNRLRRDVLFCGIFTLLLTLLLLRLSF
jgi:hypothetical protein